MPMAGIDQDRLARSFAAHYELGRGYGLGMRHLMPRIRAGESWRVLAPAMFQGTGSFGNGGAMRIGPVGGYFADDLPTVVEQARFATVVTHAHPEAAAGAIAAAVAGAVAWQAREAGERPARADLIARVLPLVPKSQVRDGLIIARDLPSGTPIREVVIALGNGSGVSAMDTVPLTLWCAGEHLDDYEAAFWLTLSAGGDVDTTCAIVGGIVALYTGTDGIPAEWRASREPLPLWAFEDAV
jgi:ADP-ribosylglycohydrolase